MKIKAPDKANAVFLAESSVKMTDTDLARLYQTANGLDTSEVAGSDFGRSQARRPRLSGAAGGDVYFGGGQKPRLFDRIRVKEALSYVVSAFFSAPPDNDRATFGTQAISNPANSPKVEVSFQDELAQILKSGFTAEELATANKALLDREVVS